jgi:excisionase family DNA binding protein
VGELPRPDDALLLTTREAASRLAIGRSTLYELIAAGEVEVVRIGRSVRVPTVALALFVERRRRAKEHVPRTA